MVVERETVNCKRPTYVEVTPTVGVLFVTILNKMTSIKNVGGDLVTRREKTITSLELARLAKRNHKDILRSIRSMEPAWEKINGRKFALVDYTDRKGERRPMYELTKTESLYAIAKFDDEVRAHLVHRWYELEKASYKAMRKTGHYELKPRLRALPYAKSAEMGRFFDELTRWTTTADEKTVAEMMNVTPKHVHEVVRGRTQSYGVCCMLVEFAKENRAKGVRRQPRAVSREADMKELRLEFMEDSNGKEGK